MILENLKRLKQRVDLASKGIGRAQEEIEIVAVTKTVTIASIKQALEAGITDIGENRVQDAILKYNAIRNTQYAIRTKWHMVGHLQTNKVKIAVGLFDLIQSVDSLRLARQIDKEAKKIGKRQDILIEVKTSPEATKFGIKPEETLQAVKEISNLENIEIRGLMTIAPIVDDPEKARPFFKKLRELKDQINDIRYTKYDIRLLSMGMTDDFEVAIEEGSTMIRIGRAIFS